MDRRHLLLIAGAALGAPTRSSAQSALLVGAYFERLERELLEAGGGAFVQGVEDRLLGEHNEFRLSEGLHSLLRSAALDQAARAHVSDLLRRNYFEHASPEGFTSEHRVGLLARRFVGAAGENIATQDGGKPPNALQWAKLWRQSPGHRANMLRPDYNRIGFGVVAKGDRTVAGAVFGHAYAELAAPAPFLVGRGDALAGVFDGTSPRLSRYELRAIDGGRSFGPFSDRTAPQSLEPGAYAIRPHVADPLVANRYWVMFGPIVVAG